MALTFKMSLTELHLTWLLHLSRTSYNWRLVFSMGCVMGKTKKKQEMDVPQPAVDSVCKWCSVAALQQFVYTENLHIKYLSPCNYLHNVLHSASFTPYHLFKGDGITGNVYNKQWNKLAQERSTVGLGCSIHRTHPFQWQNRHKSLFKNLTVAPIGDIPILHKDNIKVYIKYLIKSSNVKVCYIRLYYFRSFLLPKSNQALREQRWNQM